MEAPPDCSSATIFPAVRRSVRVARSAALGIVRHHHDRLTFPVKRFKITDHLLACLGVQISGRLIGENHGGIIRQHACQRHPLLLPHAQFTRFVMQPVAQSHALEQFRRPSLLLRFVHVAARYMGICTFSKAVK